MVIKIIFIEYVNVTMIVTITAWTPLSYSKHDVGLSTVMYWESFTRSNSFRTASARSALNSIAHQSLSIGEGTANTKRHNAQMWWEPLKLDAYHAHTLIHMMILSPDGILPNV